MDEREEQLDQEQLTPETPEGDMEGRKMGFLTKLLLIIGVVLIQVTVAYFGVKYFFFRDVGAEASAQVEQTGFEEVGPILQMDEIVVNPSGSGGRRFVVVKLALELSKSDIQKEIDKQMPVISDGLIRLLSSKSVEYLSNVAFRDTLRQEMMAAINDRLPGGEGVEDIFFTGFVLQ
jgi:flagellar basal body-associated protein FliL